MNRRRPADARRIVVTGLIAQYPLGGVAWDYLQYPAALAAMGHDVYYLEDTGQWPYNPEQDGIAKTCDYNVAHLGALMERFGLRDRWSYRFAWQEQWYGMQREEMEAVVRSADLILNVSGTLRDPAGLDRGGTLVYIDSDPVFTQLKLARGQLDFRHMVDAHDVHFSFGETLGPATPTTGHRWLPTRQPVLLDEWRHDQPDGGRYTTVMNWTSYNEVEYEGRRFGQKDAEFRRFLDLPIRAPVTLEVAMASGKNATPPYALLAHRGWTIVDPAAVCPDLDSYRTYIQGSRAEWSVAKHGYVAGRSGWFSCRSACYLAAGRPVVVQDTGFSSVIPVGEGVFAFDTVDEALEGIEQIEADYPRHSAAAREVAAEYFDASLVLTSLLDRASSTGAVREAAAGGSA